MRRADIDAIMLIQAECYPLAMQESRDIVVSRLQSAPATSLVACAHDDVCAYLFAYPSLHGAVTALGSGFAIPERPDTIYIHDLSVSRRALGRGAARALVRQLLAAAQQDGLVWSGLVSVQDSARFWGALGYKASAPGCPVSRAHLATYPGEAVYMSRHLASPKSGSEHIWPENRALTPFFSAGALADK